MAGDYTIWHVGMKVVCVDSNPRGWGARAYENGLPIEGKVYTIRAISHWQWRGESGVGIWLEEFVRAAAHDGLEYPWAIERFRPVQARKTDISIFTAMLRHIDAKAEGDGVMDMVERVARALHRSDDARSNVRFRVSWKDCLPEYQEMIRADARAAIEAYETAARARHSPSPAQPVEEK